MAVNELAQRREFPKTGPAHPASGWAAPELDLRSGFLQPPHLAGAGLASGQLALECARAITEALAVLRLPAAVLAPSHRIVAANEFMIKLIPGQVRNGGRRVTLTDRRADALLEKALLHVSDRSLSRDVCSIPIAGTADNPPSITHVVPLGAVHDISSAAACLLILTSITRLKAPASDVVQALFDLTPAEARVAAGIAGGQTPAEVAADAGVSVHTVKTHLKVVFEKTGVPRQAELVALLGGIAFQKMLWAGL